MPGRLAGGPQFELPTVTAHLTAGRSGKIETRLYGTSYDDPGLTLDAVVSSVIGDTKVPSRCFPNPNPVLKEFFDYYRMPRGFHPRSVNSTGAWNATMPLSFMNMPLLSYASEVTIPTLIVTGEKAHSRYFAEDAFKAIGSKEKALVIVPGANHVDLYDNVAGKIPFATFAQFFKTNLK